MRVRLAERRLETADVMSFTFDLGGQTLEYLPGQYLHYQLDELSFPDERGNRRHFTISSSPTEKGIVMFTTRMRGSGFKETLRHAPLGRELACESPSGRFVMPQDETRRHVLIAGGIGITPYRSILLHTADTGGQIDAVMLYFSRSEADIVFRRELEALVRRMPTLSVVHILGEPGPGWTGERGKLDEALLRRWVIEPDRSLFWISGPPPMVRACRERIREIGIQDDAIRMEGFAGYSD